MSAITLWLPSQRWLLNVELHRKDKDKVKSNPACQACQLKHP